MDQIQDAQLALASVTQDDEVERRKVAVYQLRVLQPGDNRVRERRRVAQQGGSPRADPPCQRWPRPPRSCTGCRLWEGSALQVPGLRSRDAVCRGRLRGAGCAPRRVTTLYTVRSSSCCLSTGCGGVGMWCQGHTLHTAPPRARGGPVLQQRKALSQGVPNTRRTWSGAACLRPQSTATCVSGDVLATQQPPAGVEARARTVVVDDHETLDHLRVPS